MAIAWNADYRPGGGRTPFVLSILDSPTTSPNTESPGAGALVATGRAPTVWNNASVYAPGAGTLTLAGSAPTIWDNVPLVNAPGAGAATITGHVPTVV